LAYRYEISARLPAGRQVYQFRHRGI